MIKFNNITLLKNIDCYLYTWDNFIKFFNYALSQNRTENSPKSNASRVIGHVNFWHNFTVTIDNLTDENFPSLSETIKKIEELVGNVCIGKFAAVSFTTTEPTTGKHSDPVNVVYLNYVGTSQWDTYFNNKKESFILKEGDIIFIPANVEHEVHSLSPRAAISFMFNN